MKNSKVLKMVIFISGLNLIALGLSEVSLIF